MPLLRTLDQFGPYDSVDKQSSRSEIIQHLNDPGVKVNVIHIAVYIVSWPFEVDCFVFPYIRYKRFNVIELSIKLCCRSYHGKWIACFILSQVNGMAHEADHSGRPLKWQYN